MIFAFRHAGHGFKQVSEVFKGLEAVFFGCFYYGVDDRAGFRSFGRAAEEPVFPADDEWFYAAFRSVVGDFQPAVKIEGFKYLSLFNGVAEGPAQR